MKRYNQRLVQAHLHEQHDHSLVRHAFEICLAFVQQLNLDQDDRHRLIEVILDIHMIRITLIDLMKQRSETS